MIQHWLVPIVLVQWNGKKHKRTISIRADVNEWVAQNLACIKVRWKKQYGSYVKVWEYSQILIDHAIHMDTKKCNWGCCQLGK